MKTFNQYLDEQQIVDLAEAIEICLEADESNQLDESVTADAIAKMLQNTADSYGELATAGAAGGSPQFDKDKDKIGKMIAALSKAIKGLAKSMSREDTTAKAISKVMSRRK